MAIKLKQQKHASSRLRSRLKRQMRGRKRISGTPEKPRLVVTRSTKHMFAQVVDDLAGTTLASASTMEADLRALAGTKTDKATKVGELVAERAKAAGIETVVFDRAGNQYHGRIAALADGARSGGLTF